MEKIYLQQVRQFNTIFYTGKFDPRKIVEMTEKIPVGQTQEAQRPLDEKHIKEISEYVVDPVEKGLLPASVMLATRNREKLKIKSEEVKIEYSDGTVEIKNLYYLEMPSTPQELEEYKGTIDIIDGQHRIYAFDDLFRNIDMKNSDIYEMTFSIFECPDLRTKRILFKVTNEKQKPVSGNLLLFLKDKLGMLSHEEKIYYPLISKLNNENMSPLHGRIIMSAERISKGYKSKELIKICDKSKIDDMTLTDGDGTIRKLSDDEKLKAISTYLSGWEEYFGLSFGKPGKETMTKISGLRYIFLLLPTFVDHSKNIKSTFDVNFVKSVIESLQNMLGLVDGESPFDNSLNFRGEGATVKYAQDTATGLKEYLANKASNGFNPFA